MTTFHVVLLQLLSESGWLRADSCVWSWATGIAAPLWPETISNPLAQEFMLQLQKDSARSGLGVKDDD